MTPPPGPRRGYHITTDPPGGEEEWPTIYDEGGNLFPKPSTFQEPPILAARVASGELPPVEERLPENPLVLKPTRGIGKYGGTWYRGFLGPADGQNMERPLKDHLLFYDVSGRVPQPNIAESWARNDDATEFTFTLRKGHKWSDGQPFTTADIMFWYEHMLLNDDLNPIKPAWTQHGDETLKFEAIDEQRFRVTAAKPYAILVQLMASVIVAGQHTRGDEADGLYAPKHYLEQFHPSFAGLEEANRKASVAGFDNWITYFYDRNHANANPEAPMLTAWRVTSSINTNEWSFERNPYYFAVDTEGNQLPYIDRVVLTLAQNLDVLNNRALAGDSRSWVGTSASRNSRSSWKTPKPLDTTSNSGARYMRVVPTFISMRPGRATMRWRTSSRTSNSARHCRWVTRETRSTRYFSRVWVRLKACARVSMTLTTRANTSAKTTYASIQRRRTAILDEIGLSAKDGEGFRLLPSGARLTVHLPAVVAWFEDYPAINGMIARQWATNLGIHAEIQSIERGLHSNLAARNDLLTQIWESSPRAITVITPRHLLPVAGNTFIGPLFSQWYDSGGGAGIEPANPLLREQQDLYAETISTAGPERYDAIVRRVVELNCLNVNPITTVMNQPRYVAIINNQVKNIPNPLPFSFHNQTSGNGFPEQWWIDDGNAVIGK